MRNLALLAAVLAIASPVVAADTFEKVRATRSISVGYRDGAVPFSYVVDGKPIGYTVELCMRVVAAISDSLGLPEIKPTFQPVTAANRISLVKAGAVDLECGTTANTLERQKEVAFSVTYYLAAARVVSREASKIETLRDLSGKTVVALPGATHLQMITKANQMGNLGLNIVTARERSDAFEMVKDGRAVGFISDDVLLAGLVASTAKPWQYRISVQELPVDPLGLMMRKDDAGLKEIADRVLRGLFKSGEILSIYAKWFQSPIPPHGINLDFPMSPALRKAIAGPIDSARPEDYR